MHLVYSCNTCLRRQIPVVRFNSRSNFFVEIFRLLKTFLSAFFEFLGLADLNLNFKQG